MENLEVMIVLFIIVVLGYAANKWGLMGGDFDKRLSSLVVDITCPLLVLSSVMGDDLPDRSLILPLVGISFLTYVFLMIFAFLVPRLLTKNREEQGMMGFGLMFANVGFIGYPIVSSIFGHQAVFYAALLNMPNTFFIFTVGVMLVKGEYGLRQFNPRVLFSPAMIAAFLAAVLVALGVRTPDIIARPVTMVGNITVPAALMIIGSAMANLPMRDIIGSAKVYLASAVRLFVVPLCVYYLSKLCGVPAMINDINTVVIAMPVASFGTMFCLKFGRNPAFITEMTFVTTTASILSIPLITLLFR